MDRVTTTLVHALPPCLTYCVRWYPVETDGTPVAAHRALDAYGSIDWSDILVNSMAAYFLWQLEYIVLTEVVFAKQLEADDELLTSLKWLSRDRTGAMYRLCHWLSVRLRLMGPGDVFHEKSWQTKFTFWGAQLVYTLVTLPLVRLMFNSHAAHTALLLSFLMVTIWNGASFYIEVFSHRYNWQFDETATTAAPAAPAVSWRGARELDGMTPPSAPLHGNADAAPPQNDDSDPPAAAAATAAAASTVMPAWLMHVRAAAPVPNATAAAAVAAAAAASRTAEAPRVPSRFAAPAAAATAVGRAVRRPNRSPARPARRGRG